jgi:hypothetical protein
LILFALATLAIVQRILSEYAIKETVDVYDKTWCQLMLSHKSQLDALATTVEDLFDAAQKQSSIESRKSLMARGIWF